MKLTFIESADGRPLKKQFSDKGKQDYPLVVDVNSYTKEYKSIDDFANLVIAAAHKGHCLYKGHFLRDLHNESRRGQTARDQHTEWLVLDIDSLAISNFQNIFPGEGTKLDHTVVEKAAELVISALPTPFHSVSYFAQASASFGQKSDVLALHIFFILTNSVNPRILKTYLKDLNFSAPLFRENIELTSGNLGLSYRIDISVADNSRLIYIAPPSYDGVEDPFMDPDDRFALIKKEHETIDIKETLLRLQPVAVDEKVADHVLALRKQSGLGVKKAKYKSYTIDGIMTDVVTNPDKLYMVYAYEDGEFVRYRINDSTRDAYWVWKNNPDIVRNWKGETPFLFKQADPETYNWHLETFCKKISVQEEGLKPIAFVDFRTSDHYVGLFDTVNDKILEIAKSKSERRARMYTRQYGIELPEDIPHWKYEFQPGNAVSIDFDAGFLNKYQAPEWIKNPVTIPTESTGIKLGYSKEHVETLCPTISKLITSICGDGVAEIEYFINWLAYVVQKRDKTGTAWVFHGVQGTGKGVFFHRVLSPLLGHEYAVMKNLEQIEEKFNVWMDHCLLFVLDEFHMGSARQFRPLVNKIKNLITEPRGTIRAMGTDQSDQRLYTNLIIFSNDPDAVRIQAGDRRFNVAPKQEIPIMESYPEFHENRKTADEKLENELPAFASFLLSFDVDEQAVVIPIENEAKDMMREASEDSIDMFVKAVIEGNLDFFITILDEPMRYGEAENYRLAAINYLKSVIREYKPLHVWNVHLRELRPLYNIICGKMDSDIKFGKLLSHRGLVTKDIRKDDKIRKGLTIAWTLKNHDVEILRDTYLTDIDKAFTATPGSQPQILN